MADIIVAVFAVVTDDDVVREVFKANAVPVDVQREQVGVVAKVAETAEVLVSVTAQAQNMNQSEAEVAT